MNFYNMYSTKYPTKLHKTLRFKIYPIAQEARNIYLLWLASHKETSCMYKA